MKKLILSMMVSLDGSIARPNGDLDWFRTDEEFENEMLSLLRSVDAIWLGRLSYELLADYWPSAGTSASAEAPSGFTSKDREIEFARLMNSTPKTVFSRTLTEPQWTPATVVREVSAETIAGLKQRASKDVVLFAGADIASTFANLDLFDEYRFMVHPIVLGQGTPLFKGVTAERQLKLLRARVFRSGVVLLQYARDRAAQVMDGSYTAAIDLEP